ncbi:hypothetical protein [Agromyces aureus]|uniref:Gram-positive cocci surface proteins LPxTG domain-containing protein n=1 Tax=Agromyces aureus TaxID=453304 RepID=A0A191WIH7_9MICO|nr:hypothetical protein [Agromyces aureus]ANJ27973.1 hypothetical protein ATC03_15915 [Agromyces aureus]
MKRLTAALTAAAIAAGLTIGAVTLAAPAMADDDLPGVPASEAAAVDLPDADEDAAAAAAADDALAAVDAAAVVPGVIWADFTLSRVTLDSGGAFGTPVGEMSAVTANVGADTRGVFHVSGETAGIDTGIDGAAVFQVVMLGKESGYWIASRVWATGDIANASCRVFQGDPRAGGTPAAVSPFICDVSYTQGFPNTRYTFALSLNRYVETAAVFTTTGPISLTAGHFEFDVPYGVAGTAEVAKNSSTRTETVVRDGDKGVYADNSRVEFTYRIVDDGTPTQFWIAGWSNNYRSSGVHFPRDGTCFVVDTDPIANGAPPLDKAVRVKVSPYSCELTSEAGVNTGAYEAHFTVARRAMTVLDGSGHGANTLLARELVADVCGARPDDCGLSLASATTVLGKERPMSETVLNGTDIEQTATKTVSSSETVTNSGGFEFTIKSEFDGIGAKWEASLMVHYERSVATTTSTTLSLPITAPPHTKAWWVGSPPMVHSEGTVIVLKDGVYYEIIDVSADFPDASAGAQWAIKPKTEPYLGTSVPGGPTTPDAGTSPPDADSPVGDPSATAGSSRTLASTGVSEIEVRGSIAAGAFLLAGGAVLMLVRRRRSRTTG